MHIVKAEPIWGVTLKPGFCGFITRESNIVGDGIEWFERFEDGLPFCHAFAVIDDAGLQLESFEVSIIEAHARTGVHRALLNEYFGDPNCQCFIRIPRGYSDGLGEGIVQGMEKQLGDKYGYGLILADLLANTELGHWVNEHTHDIPDRIVCKFFTSRHHRICSQAVACALKAAYRAKFNPRTDFRYRGCLAQAADTIDPKLLGNDGEVFEPVIYRVA